MSLTEKTEQDWTTISYSEWCMVEKEENNARGAQLQEDNSKDMPHHSDSSLHSTTPSERGTSSISLPDTEFVRDEARTTSPREPSHLSYNCPKIGEQEDWPAAGEWTVVYSKRPRKVWALGERLEQREDLETRRDFENEKLQGLIPKAIRTVAISIADATTVEKSAKSTKGKKTKKNKKRKAEAKKVQNQDNRNGDTRKVAGQEPPENVCERTKENVIQVTKARPKKEKKSRNPKKKKSTLEGVIHYFSEGDNLAQIALFTLALGLGTLISNVATRKETMEFIR